MIKVRPAGERGKTRTSWLDSSHTFSFNRYETSVSVRATEDAELLGPRVFARRANFRQVIPAVFKACPRESVGRNPLPSGVAAPPYLDARLRIAGMTERGSAVGLRASARAKTLLFDLA